MRFIAILLAVLGITSCFATVNNEEIQYTVFVNQAGYLPNSEKYFKVEFYKGPFSVVDLNGEVVFSGETNKWKSVDESTGMTLYSGDFSKLEIEGDYYIELGNGSKSFPFKIDSKVFNKTRNLSLKSYYLQRASMDLEEEFAGKFARKAGHTKELKYHPSSPIKGSKDVSGGWYDAGDFGRYITPGAVALGTMMIGYEQFPEKYDFDNNNIPESGNGIPDFLDEMRYELEWMLKMQYTGEGEFYGALPYMVNSKDYVWEMPHVGSQSQWIYDFSSISTATFTAVMAQGARLFEEFDTLFAEECLEAAKLSWSFLEVSGRYPKKGFQRPSDTKTGGYAYSGSDNLIDEEDRVWAAVELYRTTGEKKYNDYVVKYISSISGWFMTWADTSGFSKIQYMLLGDKGDKDIVEEIRNSFLLYCDDLAERSEGDGFRTVLRPDDYYWGSNEHVLDRANHLTIAYKLTKDMKYYNGALRQLNYVLGLNGKNMSFVAGVGSVYPEDIHHAVTATDSIEGSFPGLIPGGPNRYLDNDYTLPKYFDSDTPPALVYVDHIDSWASNENCITYNAPLIPLSAFFSN